MTDTIKPRITSIRFYTSTPRREPQVGDLRETKKHGKQVRVLQRATDHRGRPIGYVSRRGRICMEWVSYERARELGYGHHVPKEATPA